MVVYCTYLCLLFFFLGFVDFLGFVGLVKYLQGIGNAELPCPHIHIFLIFRARVMYSIFTPSKSCLACYLCNRWFCLLLFVYVRSAVVFMVLWCWNGWTARRGMSGVSSIQSPGLDRRRDFCQSCLLFVPFVGCATHWLIILKVITTIILVCTFLAMWAKSSRL